MGNFDFLIFVDYSLYPFSVKHIEVVEKEYQQSWCPMISKLSTKIITVTLSVLKILNQIPSQNNTIENFDFLTIVDYNLYPFSGKHTEVLE